MSWRQSREPSVLRGKSLAGLLDDEDMHGMGGRQKSLVMPPQYVSQAPAESPRKAAPEANYGRVMQYGGKGRAHEDTQSAATIHEVDAALIRMRPHHSNRTSPPRQPSPARHPSPPVTHKTASRPSYNTSPKAAPSRRVSYPSMPSHPSYAPGQGQGQGGGGYAEQGYVQQYEQPQHNQQAYAQPEQSQQYVQPQQQRYAKSASLGGPPLQHQHHQPQQQQQPQYPSQSRGQQQHYQPQYQQHPSVGAQQHTQRGQPSHSAYAPVFTPPEPESSVPLRYNTALDRHNNTSPPRSPQGAQLYAPRSPTAGPLYPPGSFTGYHPVSGYPNPPSPFSQRSPGSEGNSTAFTALRAVTTSHSPFRDRGEYKPGGHDRKSVGATYEPAHPTQQESYAARFHSDATVGNGVFADARSVALGKHINAPHHHPRSPQASTPQNTRYRDVLSLTPAPLGREQAAVLGYPVVPEGVPVWGKAGIDNYDQGGSLPVLHKPVRMQSREVPTYPGAQQQASLMGSYAQLPYDDHNEPYGYDEKEAPAIVPLNDDVYNDNTSRRSPRVGFQQDWQDKRSVSPHPSLKSPTHEPLKGNGVSQRPTLSRPGSPLVMPPRSYPRAESPDNMQQTSSTGSRSRSPIPYEELRGLETEFQKSPPVSPTSGTLKAPYYASKRDLKRAQAKQSKPDSFIVEGDDDLYDEVVEVKDPPRSPVKHPAGRGLASESEDSAQKAHGTLPLEKDQVRPASILKKGGTEGSEDQHIPSVSSRLGTSNVRGTNSVGSGDKSGAGGNSSRPNSLSAKDEPTSRPPSTQGEVPPFQPSLAPTSQRGSDAGRSQRSQRSQRPPEAKKDGCCTVM